LGPAPIGKCGRFYPWDMAVGSFNRKTRVAVSYPGQEGDCQVEVVTFDPQLPEKAVVQTAFSLPNLDWAYVAMSADGRYLAVRTQTMCAAYELLEDRAQLLRSWRDPLHGETAPTAWWWWQAVEMASKAPIAAYSSNRHVKVCRLPSCESVLDLQLEWEPYAIALNPDGTVLAIANADRQNICFYKTSVKAAK
jgi:hypothetical protein